MRAQVIICPQCHKKIEEPILLNDLSTAPAEHYYACPHCLLKLNIYAYMRTSVAGLFLIAFGLIILAEVGLLTLYDMTMWGKEIALIFFGSRTGEAISLGIGMKVIYYFLIGLALLILGLGTLLRRRGKAIKLRFGATNEKA